MSTDTLGPAPTTRNVDLPGGECNLAEAGQGGRPLVLVHGFSGAKEDFTPWLSRLADMGWHAVAYDNFGHGASAKPTEPADYTLAGYRDQLFGVMDSLGWTSCVVLGHSMGGMIAEEALAASPERFEAVILMDTSHGPIKLDPGYADIVTAVLKASGVKGLLDAANAMGVLKMAPSTKAVYERDPGYREFNERKFLGTAAPVFLSMMTELAGRPDRLETLMSLTVPVLVIVGEEDEAFVAECREMGERIPGARLARIESAAHCPQFEAEQAWWEALSSFLAALAASA